VQVLDERQDLGAGAAVQIAGRLVGEQDRRVDRQGAGNRHALAFAAREFFGEVRQSLAELHELQQFAGACIHLAPRPAAQVQRQADVLQAGERGQQLKNWKMTRSCRGARQAVVDSPASASPSTCTARTRAVETADEVQQRRLTSPMADDGHHRPC
jgi:hypothetical protein